MVMFSRSQMSRNAFQWGGINTTTVLVPHPHTHSVDGATAAFFPLLVKVTLLHLRVILALQIRAPRDTRASPPPRTITNTGPDPLPCSPDLSAAALTLRRAHIAVLFDNGAHLLPDFLSLAQLVLAPENVISEIWQEQPRVILLIADLFLVGQPLQNQVNESRDLGLVGAVAAISRPAI